MGRPPPRAVWRLCPVLAGLSALPVLATTSAAATAVPGQAAATARQRRRWAEALRLESGAEGAMARGDVAAAASKYLKACRHRRAPDLEADCPADHPLSAVKSAQSFHRAGRLKLRHDAEQLEYLVARGGLPQEPYGAIAAAFRSIAPKLPREHPAVDVQPGAHPLFDRAYNRALHLTRPGRLPGSVLGPRFDAAALARRFSERALPPEASGCEEQNGIAHADGVLSETVLARLREWCLESTMWFASRPGYVAAFMQEAFNAPLVVQVAEQLRQALPSILGPHRLMNMWAFKYSNNASDWPLKGTEVHADIAAVNVNLWITDDGDNEDPSGGGLVVYTKQAPRDWSFNDYNSVDRVPEIRKYLKDSGRVAVPHRRNRMVIFNSNLFHETQTPLFRPGYSSRRINLTFLFGRRCGGAGGTNEAKTGHRQRVR